MRQLPRLHDTRIELLARSRRTSTSMALEQLAPSLGQRHQRRFLPAQDIGFCVDQALIAEPSQLSLSGAGGTSAMVEEILRGYDSKRAYRGEYSDFRFTE